jgi:hypothetical protein
LILAAAGLLPQPQYMKAVDRIRADTRWGRRHAMWQPVMAHLHSVAGDRKFLPVLPGWASVAVPIAIGLMALFAIGRRLVFTLCLAALMMSYGGWWNLKLSYHDARLRSYFGIYTVTMRKGPAKVLTHGTTLHGVQNTAPGRERDATSYYTGGSGVGRSLSAIDALYGPGAHIGVVGLGTGTLACYRQPGQSWSFFEIDPAMVRIAQERFSFLARCAPDARMVLGDARLTLAREPAGNLELLVVDAFSSDAVPMHLLTQEAMGVYGRALRPDGLLVTPAETLAQSATPSVWVILSRDEGKLDELVAAGTGPAMWWALAPRRRFSGWTDDHASILPLIELPDLW